METKELMDNTADRWNLPREIVAAVAKVESGGDTWAFRFEPAFHARYVAPKKASGARPPCSDASERQALATSWGLMQVMGATARGLGYAGPFLSALADPALGLDYGCKLLASLRDRHLAAHGWPGVVAAYNAGSVRVADSGAFVNQSYVDKIARALGGKWPQ